VKLTAGTLLDGRVRYDQPAEGYRTGLEPVLLAASVPARRGDLILEAGCGAGAGLLCLAARVPEVTGLGLERDAALAAVAAQNFAANGFTGLRAEAADVTAWRSAASFDHALANPPWHDPAGTASPVPLRRAAKQAQPGLLAVWVERLARAVRPRGTVSLILPGSALVEALAALSAAKCGDIAVIPLWPRANRPAKLLILQGKFLGRGGVRLVPGLVLHQDKGFTPAADAVLRAGGRLT
jgi:tRNA1(Val) A37 N6-methylase TrmN6